MRKNEIVGLSLGIVKEGKMFLSKGYGFSEINTNALVNELTNFGTASISKLFTASAIMQLHEKGLININHPVVEYIPQFKMRGRRYRNITIRQMLNHTSGIPDVWFYHWKNPKNDSDAIRNFVIGLKRRSLRFEPGARYKYSNIAYNVLGYLIEEVTREKFEDYISKNILSPLKMDYSSFYLNKINANRRSTPHVKALLTRKVKRSKVYPYNRQHNPCGGLQSCSFDLCKWMIHNIEVSSGRKLGFRVLNDSLLNSMWTSTYSFKDKRTSIGLGWWIYDHQSLGKYVFHTGWDTGIASILLFFPKHQFGLVILTNGDYPLDAVYGELPTDLIKLFKPGLKVN